MVKNLLSPYSIAFSSFTLFIFLIIFLLYRYPPFYLVRDESQKLLQLILIGILAEPHFALTIPLAIGYKKLILDDKIRLILVPIFISIIGLLLFIYYINLFLFLFLVFNVYHINRQSRGVLILNARPSKRIFFEYEMMLHFYAFMAILVNRIYGQNYIYFSIFFCIAILISISLNKKLSENKNNNLIVIFSGFLIFTPLLIFDNVLIAFSIGVSIHYIQYLLLGFRVLIYGMGFGIFKLIGFVSIYTIVSVCILGGYITHDKSSIIIYIPAMLQMLHFYYDGFFWRKGNNYVAPVLAKSL